MGLVIRQSLIGTFFTYIGVGVGFFNNIILFPYVLNLEEIGLFKLIGSFGLLFFPLIQFGSTQLVYKHSNYLKEEKSKNAFFTFFISVLGIGASFFLGLCILFKPQIAAYFEEKSALFNTYFWHAVVFALVFTTILMLQVIISTKLKTIYTTFLNDVFVKLMVAGVVTLFLYEYYSQNGLILAFVGCYVIQLCMLLYYVMHLYKFRLKSPLSYFKKSELKRFTKFMLFVLIGASGSGIVAQIDSVMSSSKLGLDYTGIYAIAFYVAIVIEIPRRNITRILTPLVAKALQNKEIETVESLYQKSARNQFILGALFFLLIVVNIENIYSFIPNDKSPMMLEYGYPIIILIGLSKVFDMLMGCNGEILQYSEHYRWTAILIPGLALIAILLNLFFIDVLNMGLTGIALATLVSVSLYNIARAILLYYYLKILPFSLAHLKTLILALISFGAVYFIPELPLYLNIILKSFLIVAIFIGGLLFFKVSEEVNDFVIKHYNKNKR